MAQAKPLSESEASVGREVAGALESMAEGRPLWGQWGMGTVPGRSHAMHAQGNSLLRVRSHDHP